MKPCFPTIKQTVVIVVLTISYTVAAVSFVDRKVENKIDIREMNQVIDRLDRMESKIDRLMEMN